MKIDSSFIGKRILFYVACWNSSINDAVVMEITDKGYVKISYAETTGGGIIWNSPDDVDRWTLVEIIPRQTRLQHAAGRAEDGPKPPCRNMPGCPEYDFKYCHPAGGFHCYMAASACR